MRNVTSDPDSAVVLGCRGKSDGTAGSSPRVADTLAMLEANAPALVDRVVQMEPPFEIPETAQSARTASQRVAYLLSQPHDELPEAAEVLAGLHRCLPDVLRNAFDDADQDALLDVHRALFAFYEASFANPMSPPAAHERSPWVAEVRGDIERAWLSREISLIEDQLPRGAEVESAEGLCSWLIAHAKTQCEADRLVVDFLEHKADIAQFTTFVLSDAYLNYRFYDSIALAQLHYSETVKAELSRHMWDECGSGTPRNAHTRQFSRSLETLRIRLPRIPDWSDWRPYAGYNLYLCFGLNRRHYFKAIGSLAMPELFDPDRDRAVVTGLERLNFNPEHDFEYYFNHIEGDEGHAQSWLSGVITPIMEAQPEAGRELAIGGALRMQFMRRYNEYLGTRFGLF